MGLSQLGGLGRGIVVVLQLELWGSCGFITGYFVIAKTPTAELEAPAIPTAMSSPANNEARLEPYVGMMYCRRDAISWIHDCS